MSVDLHCHTKISDNSLTIKEVIQLAKENQVTHLAITDHDTTKGIAEAIAIGEELGVEIIPGIEISAYDYQRQRRAHILGYYIEPHHPALESLCQPLVEARHEASKMMVQKILEAGYEITWEQVDNYAQGGTGVYKQHIMHALLEAGYTEGIYGELYKRLFSRGDNGYNVGVAYVPLEYIDAVEAIQAIKEAQGIPVIAHPGQMGNFEAIPEWVELGLGGIETYHPDHEQDEIERCKQLAQQYNLIMTGGSDFHGFYGSPHSKLGTPDPGLASVLALKKRIAEQNFA